MVIQVLQLFSNNETIFRMSSLHFVGAPYRQEILDSQRSSRNQGVMWPGEHGFWDVRIFVFDTNNSMFLLEYINNSKIIFPSSTLSQWGPRAKCGTPHPRGLCSLTLSSGTGPSLSPSKQPTCSQMWSAPIGQALTNYSTQVEAHFILMSSFFVYKLYYADKMTVLWFKLCLKNIQVIETKIRLNHLPLTCQYCIDHRSGSTCQPFEMLDNPPQSIISAWTFSGTGRTTLI